MLIVTAKLTDIANAPKKYSPEWTSSIFQKFYSIKNVTEWFSKLKKAIFNCFLLLIREDCKITPNKNQSKFTR